MQGNWEENHAEPNHRAHLWTPVGIVLVLGFGFLLAGQQSMGARNATPGGFQVEVDAPADDSLPVIAPERSLPESPMNSEGTGPLLPSAPDSDVILYARSVDRVVKADVATGAVARAATPGADDATTRSLAVIRSRLVTITGSEAFSLSLDLADPIALGPARRILGPGPASSVWLEGGPTDLSTDKAAVVRLMGLDGRLQYRSQLPAAVTAVGAVEEGLILNTPGGVALLTASGTSRVIADGAAVTAEGAHLVRIACDEQLSCNLLLGTVQELELAHATAPFDVAADALPLELATLSPDGRRLALWAPDGARRVTIIDFQTDSPIQVPSPRGMAALDAPFSFSPDSQLLFIATGGPITVVDVGNEERYAVTALGNVNAIDVATPPR